MQQVNKKLTIAMAGGGTGGHVFPIRSLLETLYTTPQYLSQIEQVYWFWSAHSLEEETAGSFLHKQNMVFQSILSGKFRREKSLVAMLKNIWDIVKFSIWFFQSLRYLQKYHVDVVFCKGGYVALPVVFASKMLGRKLIVHESDVHPGLVNRIATKFASAVFTGFDGVLPKAKTVGQILGDEIVPAIIASSHTVRHNGTKSRNNSLPIIFLTAGSQGSKTLYETFAQVLKINLLIAESFQIFISLGKLNNQLKSLFPQKNVKTFDFLSQREMGEMYAKTDICLVRGGTTSLAEQKLFNIKSVIVPIPRTHDQMDNAKWYVEHYQDILLDQTSPTFLKDMENLFLSLRGYHKEEIKKDIFNEIQQAKKLIWKEILE